MQADFKTPMRCFYEGLRLTSAAPNDDPDLWVMASLLQDLVPALRDMASFKEGEITVKPAEGYTGYLLIEARTPHHDIHLRLG